MYRRSFVRASVLGATTTGIASGCSQAPRSSNAPTLPDDEFANHLAQLDHGMEDLRCRPIDLGRVARRASNDAMVCREDPLDEQLYRSSLRALLLTASVKDLPEADRSRPEVQTRLDAHAAEVDFAVHGMTQRLAHMPPEELARVQDRLRSDPEMAERIIEYIDDEARKSDFPSGRRRRLRRLARTALWRLRRQPAELVIHECTDKVRRLAARLAPAARETPFARPPAEDVAYWEAQTLRVVERYADATPPDAAVDPLAEVDPQRTAADVQRAKAELVVDTDPEDAAAKFKAAATLYRAAAAKLVESNEQRAARAELLDLAMTMYLSSYKLRPGDTTLLRVALAMLHAHDAAYRQAYGERRTAFPEYARLQAHTIHVQELLLLVQPEARPRVESNTAEEARYENGRRLVRTGAIVAGVGLGLLLLGFGLLFGGGLILGGAIIATIAGITLLVGIIVMVVGAVQKA